jgi:hypothetical protein
MKKSIYGKLVSVLLALAMLVAMVGCDASTEAPESQASTESVITTEAVVATEQTSELMPDVTALGEGVHACMFTVVDGEGKETHFAINTDKETVGEALLELELIKGEPGAYGLYVKEVNGITADYDVNQTYWAFYVDGEYAMSGVDTTTIEEGASYAFKVEK